MPVLLCLGVIVGVLWAGLHEHSDKESQLSAAALKLRRLKSRDISSLALSEAEDGAVLARRLGDVEGLKKFQGLVAVLKKKRGPV